MVDLNMYKPCRSPAQTGDVCGGFLQSPSRGTDWSPRVNAGEPTIQHCNGMSRSPMARSAFRQDSIHIGPKDECTNGKDGERGSYNGAIVGAGPAHLESPDELLAMLPEPLREQDLLKQITALQDRAARYAMSAGQPDGTGQPHLTACALDYSACRSTSGCVF